MLTLSAKLSTVDMSFEEFINLSAEERRAFEAFLIDQEDA